jgi:Mn2+/Fe2+ NRAMP family transporter
MSQPLREPLDAKPEENAQRGKKSVLHAVPPLLFLIMMMTNNRRIMGERVNSRLTNLLGWGTTLVTFLATLFLVGTWIL